VKGEVQTRKGLRWIPRHPETRKGVVSDEMLRGVENKHRSGDSRIGQPFELLLNPWAGKRQPGELKHLTSQRKRKQRLNLVLGVASALSYLHSECERERIHRDVS